ncbi:hypothetical protein F5Y11DRAFT_323851 [Daldinia sp. FL1419]|nr:hypothetical protein F5Y11DRAFT_323851 [Daldinia sp. FL1419]
MDEESDIDDRVASEQEEDLDEYDSDESRSEDAHGFFDMEAAESDNEDEDSFDAYSNTEEFFFPQFKLLPPELRARVWEFFDPDLREKARVFHMILKINPVEFWRSATLINQTAPARAMLATHQESRELALKAYPDTLDIHRGSGVLRYNSERDVILLSISSVLGFKDQEEFFSSLGNTKYLAFNHLRSANEEMLYPRLATHPTLKAVFYCYDCYEYSSRDLKWCASDSVHRFSTHHTEYDEISRPQHLESLFCWPDIENHRQFAEKHAQTTLGDQEPLKFWSMIEFAGEGLRRFELLEAVVSSGEWTEGWPSDMESEPDTEFTNEDEYESEGIDDATIESGSGPSEDEDDLVVQSGYDEEEEEEDLSTFNGFSPIRDENTEFYLGDDVEAGGLSSLEPESPNRRGDASEQDLSDEEPVQKIARHKRRIVSSDDEDGSDDERDEEVRASSRPAKRSRVVLSETEDEDEDYDRKTGRNTVRYEYEESDESEESEDEEPVKAKPMSLFEKLRQYRQDNPVSVSSDASSNIEASIGSEDLDGGGNADFSDDEVGDEDGLLQNGGIAADMSEEHFEDDEDDEDGW